MKLLAALILLVPTVMWGGYVVSVLWGWFIVPLGAPPVGIAHALGLMLMASLPRLGLAKTKDEDEVLVSIIKSWVVSLFALGCGALYHAFM